MEILSILNRFTLSFNDKILEYEYKNYFAERFIQQIRTAMLFGIILYGVFGFLDYMVYSNFWKELVAVRIFFVMPVFLLLFLSLLSKKCLKILHSLITVGILTGGFGIIAMICIIQSKGYENNTYLSGLLLLAFFAFIFFRLRFLYAVFSGMMIIAGYEIVSVFVTKIPLKTLIENNFFLISTYLTGMVVNYIIELDARKYFLLYRRLAIEKEYLTADNLKLEKLANLDGLTEISNKRFFMEYLGYQWSNNIKRNFLSVLMIDVDYFKKFNDTYGHLAGDNCLKIVAKTLENEIRQSKDIVARFGGEEFVILLENTDRDGAMETAKRIMERIKRLKIRHETSEVSDILTVSIGIATMKPDNNKNYHQLLEKADKALYEAKTSGRNRICML